MKTASHQDQIDALMTCERQKRQKRQKRQSVIDAAALDPRPGRTGTCAFGMGVQGLCREHQDEAPCQAGAPRSAPDGRAIDKI